MSLKIGYAIPTRISLDTQPDTIALWLVPAGGSGGNRGVTDSAPATDSLVRSSANSRSLTDAAPAADSLSRTVVITRTVTDSAPATENLNPNPYVTYTGTTANGDPWKLWVPVNAGANTPLVHFAHAYGGSYLDPQTATYAPFLAQVIAAGWAIVSTAYSATAPDQAWGAPVIASGNQRAVETCFMQADAAAKAAVSNPVTLVTKLAYGGSMGCINLLDSFHYETGITTLVGMYAVCGVYNLADLYAGAHTGHINTAYNIPAGGTYAVQTAGRDPNLATAAQNAGPTGALRFRYLFSAGDEVCHPELNAAPFVSSFAGLTGVLEASALVAPDNGIHLQGFSVGSAAATDFVTFGQRAIAGTDTTAAAIPATPSNVAGTLTTTQNNITWLDPASPSANLAGWNVYVNGVKKNGSLVKRDITGAWLKAKGNTASSTTWTDTVNAPFVASHVGQPFYGDHVPQGTTVSAVVSSSQVTLSAATTATDNTLSRLRYVAPLPIFAITGLTPGTAYTATLRSVTIDGVESADSSSVAFTTQGSSVALTDSAPATDSLTRTEIQSRSLTDSAPATDALTQGGGHAPISRTCADSAPATDTISRVLVLVRPVSDAAPATDSVTRGSVKARSQSDAAPAGDSVARALVLYRPLSDVAAATDAVTRALALSRALVDSASATDSLTTETHRRAMVDAAPAVDVVTRAARLSRTATDTATAIDVVNIATGKSVPWPPRTIKAEFRTPAKAISAALG